MDRDQEIIRTSMVGIAANVLDSLSPQQPHPRPLPRREGS